MGSGESRQQLICVDADSGELALMTLIATFGTALDITLAELSLETFLPADSATAAALFARRNSPTIQA